MCMSSIRKMRVTCSCVGCAPAVLPATAPLAPRGEQGATRTPGSSSTVAPVLVARAPDLKLASLAPAHECASGGVKPRSSPAPSAV